MLLEVRKGVVRSSCLSGSALLACLRWLVGVVLSVISLVLVVIGPEVTLAGHWLIVVLLVMITVVVVVVWLSAIVVLV